VPVSLLLQLILLQQQVLQLGVLSYYVIALFYLLFCVGFRFSLYALVILCCIFFGSVSVTFTACFVMVVRIFNGNFHAATTCLSSSATINETLTVLASQARNGLFAVFVVHFIVHII
jgi:hypothetical protein